MSASIRNSYSLRKEFTLKERIKCTYIKSPASVNSPISLFWRSRCRRRRRRRRRRGQVAS